MITRIEAYRYRCFERINVSVGNYAVLVGRNGAGKSTLIDIPVAIGEILQRQDIYSAFFGPTPSHPRPRADGALDLVHKRVGGDFWLALEIALPELIASKAQASHARYELAFAVDRSALSISQEALILYDERPSSDKLPGGLWSAADLPKSGGLRPVLERDPNGQVRLHRELPRRGKPSPPTISEASPAAPALAFVPPDPERHSAATCLRSFLSRDSVLYQPNVAKLRNAQPSPGRDFRVAADASTLAWSVLRLAQEDPEGYEEWNAHMATVLPRFVRVEARQRDDDQFAYLRAHYESGLEIPGHALSDGTLFLFAYSLLPFLDNVPEFLAIEEPEISIHPKAIEAVLETLQVMDNSQVLVTTHSPITVAVTPVDKLLCLQQTRSEGVVVTRGREHPLLENWEGIPGLGVLHSAGIL